MTILDTIVEHKKVEILKRKRKWSEKELMRFDLFQSKRRKIDRERIKKQPGIIAEFKRKSPSKGFINAGADPVKISQGYAEAGVAAMSVLTDRDFFGGSFRDLRIIKESQPDLCLLRKDFIIDPYQVIEAKAYGADIILLIAAILSKGEVEKLSGLAAELDLQVLFEVHSREDLQKYVGGIELVGVNNRDLNNFKVDVNTSLELIGYFPDGVIPVSESGLSGPGEIQTLFNKGFQLFLIGETFMKENNPGEACKNFINQLRSH